MSAKIRFRAGLNISLLRGYTVRKCFRGSSSQTHSNACRWWRKRLEDLGGIIRTEHTIVAFVCPMKEELIYYSRVQRLLCYFAEVQMALAVTAFFVRQQQTTAGAAFVALISIMFMTPITVVVPWMFQVGPVFANFKSVACRMQNTF